MTLPARDFAGRVVAVALVVRLATIMVALVGLVGETMTGPLLACILVLSAATFAMLMYAQILHFVTRHPISLVMDVLLSLAVVWVLGVESPLVLATFPVALVVGVLTRPAVATAGAVVLCAGYLLVVALPTTEAGSRGFMTEVGVPALYAALVAIGAAVRHAHEQQLVVAAELSRAQRLTAAADERARLAREMHDSLGKTLHGLSLGAQGLVGWVDKDPATARRVAGALAEGAEQAAREARELLVRMRQDEPDRALVEVLSDLCQRWQDRTGVTCRFTAHDAVDLAGDARYEALAVVAEALENVARHAEAGRVHVSLERDRDGAVRIGVRDDGTGFTPAADGSGPPGHFGLVGMRERAVLAGARLDLRSAPGAGTTVELVWEPQGASSGATPDADPERVPRGARA